MSTKLDKWNDAYEGVNISEAESAQILVENCHLLPEKGTALDLACGRAGNAIFLAQQGFNVDVVDNSPVIIEKVDKYAKHYNLSIRSICHDVEKQDFLNKQYDVIVVSYFLNRALFPKIIKTLKPNGLLFYETWSQQKIDDSGPKNYEFRLNSSELLSLTASLKPVFYREEGSIGNISKGKRNIAMIICQKA